MNEENKEDLKEFGQVILEKDSEHHIMLLTIIGEIEGHEAAPEKNKTTRYDHVLPRLAEFEDDDSLDGLLVLLNTQGGDVDAGLAIAEMIATLSKPTVSLVLGGSHSIGVPLAVSTDYSFIVASGTLLIHPVRMGGMVIGAPQSYAYFKRVQDRITILVGEEAVREGLIDEVGGIAQALAKLKKLIGEKE